MSMTRACGGILLACLWSLAMGCAPSESQQSGCENNLDCPGGQVCVDQTCKEVCISDDQCPGDLACIDDACAPCDGCRQTPEITSVDGTGTTDGNASHAEHHLVDRVVLTGENLEGASVTLRGPGDDDGRKLELCQAPESNVLAVALPEDVEANTTYTLDVSNQAGSCTTQVTLLQGERGPAGEYTPGDGIRLDAETINVDSSVVRDDDPRFDDIETSASSLARLEALTRGNMAHNGAFDGGTRQLQATLDSDVTTPDQQGDVLTVVPAGYSVWNTQVSDWNAQAARAPRIPDSNSITLVSDNRVGGRSIELARDGIKEPVFGLQQYIYRPGALPARLVGRSVTLTVWYKRTIQTNDVGRVGLLSTDDGSEGAHEKWLALTESSTWARAELQYTIPPGAELLKLVLSPSETSGAVATYRFSGVMVTEGNQILAFRRHPHDDWPRRTLPKHCRDWQRANPSLASGLFPIDPDGNGELEQAYCDMDTAGGGWTLMLAYEHPAGGTEPLVPNTLPTEPQSGYSHAYLDSLGLPRGEVQALRFYCRTDNHNRTIHFITTNDSILTAAYTGGDGYSPSDWNDADTTTLIGTDHNANLPFAAQSTIGNFTKFPFYEPGDYHWGLDAYGSNRWECDDYPGGPGQATLHQVWFR